MGKVLLGTPPKAGNDRLRDGELGWEGLKENSPGSRFKGPATFDKQGLRAFLLSEGSIRDAFAASDFHFKWALTGRQFQEYARSETMGLDDQSPASAGVFPKCVNKSKNLRIKA